MLDALKVRLQLSALCFVRVPFPVCDDADIVCEARIHGEGRSGTQRGAGGAPPAAAVMVLLVAVALL